MTEWGMRCARRSVDDTLYFTYTSSRRAGRHFERHGQELPMRLSESDIAAIKRTSTEIFGPQANIWLFGSRTDDTRRGGDIDLMIENVEPEWDRIALEKARFLARLKTRIGDRRIDLVVQPAGSDRSRQIAQAALQTGIRL